MSEAAKRVLEGRISQMLLNEFSGWELVQAGIPTEQFSESSTFFDEWDDTTTRIRPSRWNEKTCTEHALKVEDGMKQENII